MRKTLLIATMVLATPASAKPVYLDCLMSYKNDAPRHWQINFDAEQGTLTWASDNGHAGRMSAIFTADTVTASTQLNSDTTRQWTINRATGVATDTFIIGSQSVESSGTCKLLQPPKLQF